MRAWSSSLACSLSGIVAAAQQVAGAPWREAPEYLPLFAPAGARAASYRIVRSPRDLADDAATARGGRVRWCAHLAPGRPGPTLPLDAFGLAGSVRPVGDGPHLRRPQPQVARGARMENGRVVESWTLISPYPDPALRRLETGTLLVVLRLP